VFSADIACIPLCVFPLLRSKRAVVERAARPGSLSKRRAGHFDRLSDRCVELGAHFIASVWIRKEQVTTKRSVRQRTMTLQPLQRMQINIIRGRDGSKAGGGLRRVVSIQRAGNVASLPFLPGAPLGDRLSAPDYRVGGRITAISRGSPSDACVVPEPVEGQQALYRGARAAGKNPAPP